MGHFIKDTMLSEWAETSSVQNSSHKKYADGVISQHGLSVDGEVSLNYSSCAVPILCGQRILSCHSGRVGWPTQKRKLKL